MTALDNKPTRKPSNAPVKMFQVIRDHGAGILAAFGKQEDSLRSIARQFGLTPPLLARSLPVISKFEADIARGDFSGIERHLFEPVGRDYKLMPFYKKLTGQAAARKPRKQRVGEGSGAPPRLPAAPAAAQPAKYPTAGPQSQIPQAAPVAESDAADTPVAPKSGSPAVAFKSPALTAPAVLPTPPTVSAASPTKLSVMANPFQKTQTPIQRFEAAPPTSP